MSGTEPQAQPRKRVRVVAAVVFDGPRLLMTQRPPGGPLGLQWEFPGGKARAGRGARGRARARGAREELGVESQAHDTLAVHEFDYAHGVHVELTFVRCTLASHAFTPAHAVHASRWVLRAT